MALLPPTAFETGVGAVRHHPAWRRLRIRTCPPLFKAACAAATLRRCIWCARRATIPHALRAADFEAASSSCSDTCAYDLVSLQRRTTPLICFLIRSPAAGVRFSGSQGNWYLPRDSNPDASRHADLSRMCLPIPPRRHMVTPAGFEPSIAALKGR